MLYIIEALYLATAFGYPASWINGRRWEDHSDPALKAKIDAKIREINDKIGVRIKI